MANEDRGKVKCPFSGDDAPVRKNKKGKGYFNCPKCGIVQPHGAQFQRWLMDNAVWFGPDGDPEKDAPAPPPVEVEKPVEVESKTPAPPAPQPSKKSALDGWAL